MFAFVEQSVDKFLFLPIPLPCEKWLEKGKRLHRKTSDISMNLVKNILFKHKIKHPIARSSLGSNPQATKAKGSRGIEYGEQSHRPLHSSSKSESAMLFKKLLFSKPIETAKITSSSSEPKQENDRSNITYEQRRSFLKRIL